MAKLTSIAFVVPYFGVWPNWFPFFLQSCSFNPSIDWLFITDCGVPENQPANTQFIEKTFNEYQREVSDKLGINFLHAHPYKLCDIKPAYGLIHQELLSSYEFWGFCDIDVMFGNIRKFMTEDVLKHDVISAHEARISGHFSLFRNNELFRNAFQQVDGWKGVFEDEKHHRFDEAHFSKLFIWRKNWPKLVRDWLAKFSGYSCNTYFVEQYSTPGCRHDWVDGSRDFPSEWYWDKGRLTNNRSDREFMYFHFLKWKQKIWNPSYQEIKGLNSAGNMLCEDEGLMLSESCVINEKGFVVKSSFDVDVDVDAVIQRGT